MARSKVRRTGKESVANPPELTREGLVIIDENFSFVALDAGAQDILSDLNGQAAGVPGPVRLSPELLGLLYSRTKQDLVEAPIIVKVGSKEYSCRVFLLNSSRGSGEPTMALHFKRVVSFADAIHRIGSEYHLTDREQEVLVGVAMGLTSKELAPQMGISPNTVKAFLRLIMIKMGVTTRSGIVGKLLDQNERRSMAARQRDEE
jgi:DNA-binding CsgD family transcriptional regulator